MLIDLEKKLLCIMMKIPGDFLVEREKVASQPFPPVFNFKSLK